MKFPGKRGVPVFGIILITVGGLLLADNFGLIEINFQHLLARFWPMVLVFLGVDQLTQGQRRGGLVLVILGVALQLLLVGWLNEWTLRRWWPLLLILLGAGMIHRHYRGTGSR